MLCEFGFSELGGDSSTCLNIELLGRLVESDEGGFVRRAQNAETITGIYPYFRRRCLSVFRV